MFQGDFHATPKKCLRAVSHGFFCETNSYAAIKLAMTNLRDTVSFYFRNKMEKCTAFSSPNILKAAAPAPLYAYLCVSVHLAPCPPHDDAPSQMGSQRGVAWGPSPGSEMLIMNINTPYTQLHMHIFSLWLQHLSVLLSRTLFGNFFFSLLLSPSSVLSESTKAPGSTFPPGQHLVSAVCLYPPLLLCMKIIFQLPAIHPNPYVFCFPFTSCNP